MRWNGECESLQLSHRSAKFWHRNIEKEERNNKGEGIGVRQHLSEGSLKCSTNLRYKDRTWLGFQCGAFSC